MTEKTKQNLGLAKTLIWNRRYKAWRCWFFALVLVTLVAIFKDTAEIFKAYALWSTIGLVGLIGGLSLTDIAKIKNGVSL